MSLKPVPKPPFKVGPSLCLEHGLPGDCAGCARADRLARIAVTSVSLLVIATAVYEVVRR